MIQSHLLIHRSPERWEFYASAPPVVWSEQLECWITTDRDIILSVLKDRSFAVVDFVQETARLSQRFDIELSATQDLLSKVPLALEGREHATVRREMALKINGRIPQALEGFSDVVDRQVGSSFNDNASFDIVSDIISPAVKRLMSGLSGIALDEPQGDTSLPQIFDRMLSINRRRLLDKHIDATIKAHANSGSIGETLMSAAMSVVGSDSILGSLTLSFIDEIERNPGKRMSEISWSDMLPATAVPYVERIAAKTISFGETRIEKGERIRLCLEAFNSADSDDLDYFFGAGRHVCLGKAVSIKAWQSFTGALGRIEKKVQIKRIAHRKSDFLFNTPTIVKIVVPND